jgi:hypothetical protein
MCIVGSYLPPQVYNYPTEIYPSTYRGFVSGLVIVVGNMAASLIPYMGVLAKRLGVHFLSGFLPLAWFSFIFAFFLPETIHKTLQN